MNSLLELNDIQSGVLRPRPAPYVATYIALRIDDRLAGRELMSRVSQVVTSAANPNSPLADTWVSVAVTYQGLKALGVAPLARIVHMTVIGHDPVIMLEAPIPATKRALEKAGHANRLALHGEAAGLNLREVENLVDEIHHSLGLALRLVEQVGVERVELRPLLRQHEFERSLDTRERPAQVVDDLRREIRLRLFGLPLLGDVLEGESHGLPAILADVHDAVDAIDAAAVLHVDRPVGALHEESLQPASFAGHRAFTRCGAMSFLPTMIRFWIEYSANATPLRSKILVMMAGW